MTTLSQEISQTESVLNEADPESLNELMARDPLALSKQDIAVIVKALRKQRVTFETNEKAKPQKAAAKPKLTEAEKKKLLDNLELDL